MLTPQDITEKLFNKAVFGGYDMTEVDEFFETVSADYTSLFKENAILKGKLKVLVEKVEEYRSTEDAMRMALLTAQRMGEEITKEANKRKDEMLKQAEADVKGMLTEAARSIAGEEMRLNAAAKETSKFIELSRAIMRKHSEFLTKLEAARRTVDPSNVSASASAPDTAAPQTAKKKSTAQPAEPIAAAPAAQEPQPPLSREEQIANTAEMIGSVMEKLTGFSAPDDEPVPPPQTAQPAEQPQPLPVSPDFGDTRVFSAEDDPESVTPRPKFDFDDLKFGSNFSLDK